MKTVPAKITKPSLSGIVYRERLFRKLDSGRQYPVVWITGPPGSGKTSVLCSYLAFRDLSCLWYQVDKRDEDIATFFYFMGLAVKRLCSGNKKFDPPLFTQEYQSDPVTFTRRFFEISYNELPESPFVIVLDNYQEISDDSKLHEVIETAIMMLPESTNIFILSRNNPPSAFVRIKAKGLLYLIDWSDLRFTERELFEMLLSKEIEPTEQQIRQILDLTYGWAAGIVLLLERLKKTGRCLLKEDLELKEDFFNYFAKEVFEFSSKDIKDFLVKTSLLPDISVQDAERLTENAEAKRILSDLSRKNFFTFQLHSEKPLYRYHPLFREFLIQQLNERFTEKEVSETRFKAARILESEGMIDDSLALFHKEDLMEDAVRLILKNAGQMVLLGRGATLDKWIEGIPEHIKDNNPLLLYWQGLALMPSEQQRCFIVLDRAFSAFRDSGDIEGMFLSLSAIVDAVGFGFNDYSPLDRYIKTMEDLYRKHKDDVSLETRALAVSNLIYAIVIRQPDHPDIERYMNEALPMIAGFSDKSIIMNLFVAVGLYNLFAGEFEMLSEMMTSLSISNEREGMSPLSSITLMAFDACYYAFTGQYSQCMDKVDSALKLSKDTGVRIIDPFLYGYGACCALSEGLADVANNYMDKMSTFMPVAGNWVRCFYHLLCTWRMLINRDVRDALPHSKAALCFAERLGMPQMTAIAHLGLFIVTGRLGDAKEAMSHFTKVLELCGSMKLYQIEFSTYLALAQLDGLFESISFEGAIKKALSIGQSKGLFNGFYWIPSEIAEIIARAMRNGIEREYARDIALKRRLEPLEPPYDIEDWPWYIEIYTLGGFHIKKEGKDIKLPARTPKITLSMLKALIAYGGRDVGIERLIDSLWDESPGDTAYQTFKTTLYRLRRLLGDDSTVLLRDGRLTLNSSLCYLDIHAFEDMLKRADTLMDTDLNESLRLTKRAISLYKGPFLGNITPESWALQLRERLRIKFVRSIVRLGSALEDKDNFSDAAEYYERGLEADDLSEELYYRLMKCYLSQKRVPEALSVYERYRMMLENILSIKPSERMKMLYETALRI